MALPKSVKIRRYIIYIYCAYAYGTDYSINIILINMLNFKNKTMKKLLLLTKTLLAAALLCVGQNAWGAPIEVVGKTDKTSDNTTHSTTNIVLKKGETKVITFNNYGSTGENYYNWTIVAKEGSTEKFSVRADSYDNTTRAASNVTSYRVATSRGGDKGWLDWDTFKSDMQNASCVAQITYGTDNKLSLRTTSECSTGKIYYVDHDVTGLTGADVNIVFYVNHSYLEIMSINSPQEVLGAIDNTTGYEASIRGAINKEYTLSRGDTKKFTFYNHGKGVNNYDNWSLRITNSGASFDRGLAGGNHINLESGESSADAYAGITQKWFIDGVDNYTTFMSAYKTQMMNANVTMTVEYSSEGAFSVTAESTMGGHEYRYVFTRSEAFTGDVNIKLGVDCAWLEIFSDGNSVPVTISSYGYATFSSTSPVNVNVTGLEAYIATEKSGDYVIMEKVTGDVDANTGLVLKGVAGTYSLPIVGSGTSYSTTNKLFALDGSYPELGKGSPGTNYVLSVQSENVVWAPINTDKAPVTAGHAALYLDGGGARAMIMSFGDDITSVENVEAAPAEAKAKEGKFIENGKLVIVKNGVKYNAAGAKLY